jgi:hypothetical protein
MEVDDKHLPSYVENDLPQYVAIRPVTLVRGSELGSPPIYKNPDGVA